MKPVVNDSHLKSSFTQGSRDRSKERKHFHEKIEKENRKIIDYIGKAMSSKTVDNDVPAHTSPSLIVTQRRRELRRVTIENEKMLERLRSVSPVYNRTKWEQEAARRAAVLRVISEFPEAARPPRSGKKGDSDDSSSQSIPLSRLDEVDRSLRRNAVRKQLGLIPVASSSNNSPSRVLDLSRPVLRSSS